MKKPIIIILCILMMIHVFILVPVFLAEISGNGETGEGASDYARITDVDYKAVVVDEPGSQGKVVITERLTFDIHAASKNNPFWELWRDLPEDTIDGVKVDYKVNSVKQVFENKSDVIYKESSRLYWDDDDYTNTAKGLGPGKWYHSEGPYNESKRRYECVFFYVDGIYRDKVVFEIEYEMNNAALRYNDSSELYLSMYSEDTIKYLKSFKGQILFKNENMPSDGNYYAHTYGTNSHTFPFTESTTINPGYHTFSFELDESQLKFKPYNQYIEFSLISFGADKHVFTKYASVNKYYYDNVLDESIKEQEKYEALPENYKMAKVIVLVIFSACSIYIIIWALKVDEKMKKKHIFYSSTMNIDYFRDIPSDLDPVFASTLVFCKDKSTKIDIKDGYAAILLSLVHKGYIELVKINNDKDWNFDNVNITVKYKPMSNISIEPAEEILEEKENLPALTLAEEQYFNLIIRYAHDSKISMKELQDKISQDFENTDSFVKNIENSITSIGTTKGYFQKANYEEPKQELSGISLSIGSLGFLILILGNMMSYRTRLDLAFGAFFILGIAFIISAIYIFKVAKKYVLLTQFGEDEYAKWRGLYNFLNSETLINERTIIELPIWEKYLIYGTAFGISEKVIKAIKIRCQEIEKSPILGNPYYYSSSFRHSSHTFRRVTYYASTTARSGGYGGHGGYGGGGRGGGGGRRRSLKFRK